ncbi:MAG: hypothetical protein BroJett029_37880 [Alphaproteobacteria bacterium]|nr:MAG: hypothetical protein BroJett029_37880 [Alphaproteobacteria bacterium]
MSMDFGRAARRAQPGLSADRPGGTSRGPRARFPDGLGARATDGPAGRSQNKITRKSRDDQVSQRNIGPTRESDQTRGKTPRNRLPKPGFIHFKPFATNLWEGPNERPPDWPRRR